MDVATPTSLSRHVYRLKWWAQAWYLALGIFCGGIGVIVVVVVTADINWRVFANWTILFLCVIFPFLGYYFLALALRSRVVLDDTGISVRFALAENSANFNEIEGYRITVTKNASFWRLELKDNKGYVAIMRLFRVDDYFRAWLQQLKNLDEDKKL